MESLELLSDYEKQNLFIAIATLFLGIITILSYMYTGAGVIFFIFAVITVIVGLYMALRISNEKEVLVANEKKTKKQ